MFIGILESDSLTFDLFNSLITKVLTDPFFAVYDDDENLIKKAIEFCGIANKLGY